MQRLTEIDGIGAERARRICDPRGEDAVATERAKCHAAGVRIIESIPGLKVHAKLALVKRKHHKKTFTGIAARII